MSKEEIINKIKPAVILALFVTVVSVICIVFTDNSKVKTQFDGVVMTDKAGKSYMLEHAFDNKFKIVEFDTVNMRAKRN